MVFEKFYFLTLALSAIFVVCNGCDPQPIIDCIRSIEEVKSLEEAAENKSPDEFWSTLKATDPCEFETKLTACVLSIPPECMEKVPEPMQKFVGEMMKDEDVLNSLGDGKSCEKVSKYIDAVDNFYECGKQFENSEQGKEQGKILNSLIQVGFEAYTKACCFILSNGELKEESLEGCDDTSKEIFLKLDKHSIEFYGKVCANVDLEGDVCKKVLEDAQ